MSLLFSYCIYISRDLVESLHNWVIYSLNEENNNYNAKADDEIEVFYVCKVWYKHRRVCHRGGLQLIDLLYETSASRALSCGNTFNKAINVANILMINSHGDVILIIWNCILRLNQCTFAPSYFPIFRDLQRTWHNSKHI